LFQGTFSWDKPHDVITHDEEEWRCGRELRLRGFTSEQEAVAEKLQAVWRGKKMVEQFRLIIKAKNIMRTCEDEYMSDPTSIAKTCNYMLYVHLFPPHDLDRARKLYTKAMEKMQQRGPDHSFILYSFLIFLTATQEEDDSVLYELHRRAKIADQARGKHARSAFELADIGFYRMAAVMHPEDAMCQMNYAISLQWYRNDYKQSEEFYKKAARLTMGRNPLIMTNYNWMLKNLMGADRFGEDALHQESKEQAEQAMHEWNDKVKQEAEIEQDIEHAAALCIQYRFRLKRQGLLRYWPFEIPSYRDIKMNLLLKKKKLHAIEEELPPPVVYEDPTNWELCNDGHSNQYYYNSTTGTSSWERPLFQIEGIELELGPGWEDGSVSLCCVFCISQFLLSCLLSQHRKMPVNLCFIPPISHTERNPRRRRRLGSH